MPGLGGAWSGGCLVWGGAWSGGVSAPRGVLVQGACSQGVLGPGGLLPGGFWSRGVSALGVSAPGCLVQGGVCSEGVSAPGGPAPGGYLVETPPGRPLLRAVCILLECILVYIWCAMSFTHHAIVNLKIYSFYDM